MNNDERLLNQQMSESTVLIRNADQKDTDILCVFNQAMAFETEDKRLHKDTVLEGVRQVLRNPELGFYLVAEMDNQAAGSLMITTEWSDWRNGLFWWIQSVYVLPQFRRKGLFSKLYAQVIELAQQSPNVCGIRLYVEKDNVNAQNTYTALGMSETDYKLYEVEFEKNQAEREI